MHSNLPRASRRLCSLALLAAAFSGMACKPAVVTVDVEPMPLSKALDRLSTTLGEQVSAPNPLHNETLMVYAPNVSRTELLEKISVLLSAPKGEKIVDRFNLRNAESISDGELEEQRFQAMIDAYEKEVRAYKPFTPEYAQSLVKEIKNFARLYGDDQKPRFLERRGELNALSPMGRLRCRMFLAIAPGYKKNPNGRELTIFSMRPAGPESPLPKAVEEAVKTYFQEQNVWAKATGGKPIKTGEPYGSTIDLATQVAPIQGPPSEIVVQAIPNLTFTLTAYDAKGQAVVEVESSRADYEHEAYSNQFNLEGVDDESWKRLSPDTQTYARTVRPLGEGPMEPLPSSAQWSGWSTPTAKDPLAYHAGEFLKQEAKAKGKALIALVPDTFFGWYRYGLIDLVKQLQTANPPLNHYCNARVEEDEKWIVIRPTNYSDLRSGTYDRFILEKEIALRQRAEPTTLEEEAELALSRSPWSDYSLVRILVDSLGTNPFDTANDPDLLRFYGNLGPTLRAKAMSPSAWDVKDLAYMASSAIKRFITERNSSVEPNFTGVDSKEAPRYSDRYSHLDPYNPLSAREARAWAAAISAKQPNIRVRMTVKPSYRVETRLDSPNELNRESVLEELTLIPDNPSKPGAKVDSGWKGPLRLVRVDRTLITFELPSGYKLSGSLNEYHREPEPPFSLENIPPRVQSMIQAEKAQLAKRR